SISQCERGSPRSRRLPQRPVTAPQDPDGDERVGDSMRHDGIADPAAPLLGAGIEQSGDGPSYPAVAMKKTKGDRGTNHGQERPALQAHGLEVRRNETA